MSKPNRRRPHRHARGRHRLASIRLLTAALVALAAVLLIVGALIPSTGTVSSQPARDAALAAAGADAPDSTAEPRSDGVDDAGLCTVSFAGEDVHEPEVPETVGELYHDLPVPSRTGWVFAGWYADDVSAASADQRARVNGAHLVDCTDGERTLHAAWQTPDAVRAADVRVPILMYHQFTTKPEGESGWLRLNYAYIGDFEEHIRYISENDYYLPTWDELDAFVDGRLALPRKSVIVTDDDADSSWIDLAAPIVERYKVMTTSFVITSARTDAAPNRFVLQRSHTDDMHRAGANGRGRMVNESAQVVAQDLQTSADILGVKEVVAYPFGHHNAVAEQGVRQAGFDLAVTVAGGTVHQGSDKLALPRVRIDYGTKLATVKAVLSQ
ncbi:polysaccharide deacetylase family protein [Pseudoclavibacter sp. 13-3]|uniref:polysaccharide deacetylase family protein n=1 Tax=Pseudoclavibacter sp. 13-3 TaxID=2901228 RepID=UPI001E44555B|nr:polysaccharide deacetylase family protein [Pseudoclavibacter sp. 13-3]MCD7100692.1 polysaccharide deacetylase family protein [Pseudoclavibacter sp. 13-3]